MRKFVNPIIRLLARAQRRFQSSRAGSVMILVITLLVLMALIGTAFLTTARTDRYAAQTHSFNVQIDLLLTGLQRAVIGLVGQNATPNITSSATTYQTTTGTFVDAPGTNWLSSRVPTTMGEACSEWNGLYRDYQFGEWVQQAGDFYVCQNINGIAASSTNLAPASDALRWRKDPTIPNTLLRDSPCWPALTAPLLPGTLGYDNNGGYDGSVARFLARPVALSDGSPGLRIFKYSSATGPTGFVDVPAASASGDGIADSMLWRLLPGEINGVSYFAAVKIIDGNSALNLNTGNSALFDFDGKGNSVPVDAFFPGNVGLMELFPGVNTSGTNDSTISQPYLDFNLYRHSGLIVQNVAPNFYDSYRINGIVLGTGFPISDNGNNRVDFRYRTEADAQFMGFGRRTDNAGYSLRDPNDPLKLLYFSGFTWSDSAALAYRMEWAKSNVNATAQAEQVIPGYPGGPDGLVFGAPQQRFGTGNVGGAPPTFSPASGWFGRNYFYGNPVTGDPTSYLSNGASFNIRPLVVAKNPVNNLMPTRTVSSTLYPVGLPQQMTGIVPGVSVPTNLPKVSLNTADATTNNSTLTGQPFHWPTLWYGFYNSMADALSFPNTPSSSLSSTDPRQPPGVPPFQRAYPQQFRSSLREPSIDPTTPAAIINLMDQAVNANRVRFTPQQMLLLRSLIAAVNAKDMRDSDDDVSSETVSLGQVLVNVKGVMMPKDVNVTVFGTERQPFITEIYVSNDNSPLPLIPDFSMPPGTRKPNPLQVPGGPVPQNPHGYVGIELYNPYDVPINLAGWTLGILDRDTSASNPDPYPAPYPAVQTSPIPGNPGMHLRPIPSLSATLPAPPFVFGNVIIQPRCFVILENLQPVTVPPPTIVDPNSATYRPFENYLGYLPPTGNPPPLATGSPYVYVPNLHLVLRDTATPGQNGGELILLRPRRADGVISTTNQYGASNASIQYYEGYTGHYLDSLVPIDSFDFTGFAVPAAGTTVFQAWHYVRSNSNFNDSLLIPPPIQPRPSWKQVYPGRWDATGHTGAPTIREDGVYATVWDTNLQNPMDWTGFDPWMAAPPGYPLPVPPTPPSDGLATAPINMGRPDYASSYTEGFAPIQLNNTGFNYNNTGAHGWNKNFVTGSSPDGRFPFGGFARAGDVLQVPFIGAYTVSYNITDTNGNSIRDLISGLPQTVLLEMNTVTRDAGLADDLDDTNNPSEYIGTLCPTLAYNLVAKTTLATIGTQSVNIPTYDYYGWASHVLEYFTTIHAPHDDYFPHADPNYDPTSNILLPPPLVPTFATANLNGNPPAYKNYNWDPSVSRTYPSPLTVSQPLQQPVAVANSAKTMGSPNIPAENTTGVEGLVNINTAPWRVLAAIPWTAQSGASTPADVAIANGKVARQIVQYRNQWGPFKSIMDLNRVDLSGNNTVPPTTPMQLLNGDPGPAGTDFNSVVGDFTPNMGLPNGPNAAGDGIKNDVKERMQVITRVSNLITTRSDTFTVYISIQGYRGFNSPAPELVVQRRSAFIVDRSAMPASGYPKVVTNVPTQ